MSRCRWDLKPGLRSRSWSRPELEPAGALAGAGAGILKFQFRLRLPAPAPGQTKVVYLIIIHIEKDQKSIFFPKNHEKSTFSFKSCENRHPQSSIRSRSRLRSRSGNFFKVGAGAGAEKNSFGSATLLKTPKTGVFFHIREKQSAADVYLCHSSVPLSWRAH
jgi:hypothetical protein